MIFITEVWSRLCKLTTYQLLNALMSTLVCPYSRKYWRELYLAIWLKKTRDWRYLTLAISAMCGLNYPRARGTTPQN